MTLAAILKFRKENSQCVSTTHTMTYEEFVSIQYDLKRNFNKFTVEIIGDKVSVRIPAVD